MRQSLTRVRKRIAAAVDAAECEHLMNIHESFNVNARIYASTFQFEFFRTISR